MGHTNKNNTYILLKATIYTIGLLSLVFLSNLWIGSEENWDEIVTNEFIPALITRTIFLIVAGLLFLGISFGLDHIYKIKGRFSRDLFFLTMFSLVLNLIMMLVRF
ncbi:MULTISPECIES: hypothetical protein [Chryseobacterium]|uniref:hypothetical protein n=1 Tax=Chryseobacterium TaxID=59732 RepID=UPI001BE716A9|nr:MULTISPECIES: hypothetical protein [Chryseobacterium]MBT2620060.1 hypothetical protein [Chryseobacterium sp. ISL-6]